MGIILFLGWWVLPWILGGVAWSLGTLPLPLVAEFLILWRLVSYLCWSLADFARRSGPLFQAPLALKSTMYVVSGLASGALYRSCGGGTQWFGDAPTSPISVAVTTSMIVLFHVPLLLAAILLSVLLRRLRTPEDPDHMKEFGTHGLSKNRGEALSILTSSAPWKIALLVLVEELLWRDFLVNRYGGIAFAVCFALAHAGGYHSAIKVLLIFLSESLSELFWPLPVVGLFPKFASHLLVDLALLSLLSRSQQEDAPPPRFSSWKAPDLAPSSSTPDVQ